MLVLLVNGSKRANPDSQRSGVGETVGPALSYPGIAADRECRCRDDHDGDDEQRLNHAD